MHYGEKDFPVGPVLVGVRPQFDDRQPCRATLGLDPLTVRARQPVQAPQSALAAGRELVCLTTSIEESERDAHLECPRVAALAVILDFPPSFVPIRQIGLLRWDKPVGDQANLAVTGGLTIDPLDVTDLHHVAMRNAPRPDRDRVDVADGKVALLCEFQ